jgi:hypothetical protein
MMDLDGIQNLLIRTVPFTGRARTKDHTGMRTNSLKTLFDTLLAHSTPKIIVHRLKLSSNFVKGFVLAT